MVIYGNTNKINFRLTFGINRRVMVAVVDISIIRLPMLNLSFGPALCVSIRGSPTRANDPTV